MNSVIVGQGDAAAPPRPTSPAPRRPEPRTRRGWPIFLALLLAAGGIAVGFWYVEHGHKEAAADESKSGTAAPGHETPGEAGTMRVEVTHPRRAGLDRKLSQVCSVHAFEYAQLYAKISGFLQIQNVDIGDRVKKDQLLAEIYVPEIQKSVEQAAAALEQSKANIKVAEAKIRSAQSLKKASEAMVEQSRSMVAAKTAYREYRAKQLDRIRGLVERNAVEVKLLDEAQDQYESSVADEKTAQAAVLTAQADLSSKQALIEQAEADLIESRANVNVAEANLAKAKVMADYTRITSPYDGVITLRSFHRGDFIRSASEGGSVPLLAVARTDLMRVVIPVPDREVPFTDKGDQATIVLDALPGREFKGTISRFSESENPQDRNMRTEVDLENKDGKLREGMYGRVTLLLERAAPSAVTVPSSSLLKQSSSGDGQVYVVRAGKAHKVDVRIGIDNGNEAEVLTGLSPEDQVIVRYNGALSDGMPVAAESAKLAQAGG